MNISLVSPEGVRFEGEAKSISLPAWDGQLGVLTGHAPMIGLLGSGELRLSMLDGSESTFFLAGGVFMITSVGTTLLTDDCSAAPLDQESNDGMANVDDIWEQVEDSVVNQQVL